MNGNDAKIEEEDMPRRKKTDLEKILDELEKWNRETRKYLEKMYKKKGNPGDDLLRILDGISRQNDALTMIITRVESLPKIRDNTTYMLAILSVLTAYLLGLGFWLFTHL